MGVVGAVSRSVHQSWFLWHDATQSRRTASRAGRGTHAWPLRSVRIVGADFTRKPRGTTRHCRLGDGKGTSGETQFLAMAGGSAVGDRRRVVGLRFDAQKG